MLKYYIIPIYGCTDPKSLIGPYKTYQSMLRRARKIYAMQREEDAIFWTVVEGNKTPYVGSFTNNEMES